MSRAGTTWQRIKTVPGLKRDVGALLALAIAAVISTVAIQNFLTRTGYFTETATYQAEFSNVEGLNPGATTHFVSIAGVRLGDVTDFKPTNRGTTIVTMVLTKPFGTIYDNATAVLRPKNALNDMSITIGPGGPPGRPLPEGGLIPVGQTKRPIQINEALGHLDERTQDAVTGLMLASDVALADAPKQLPEGLRAVDGTLDTLRPAMEALEVRRDNINKLVTALSQIAQGLGGDHDRAVRLASSIEQTLHVLSDNDNQLTTSLNELPGLNTQLRNALSSTQELTKELNPTLDNLSEASEELPKALNRFRDTTEELGRTLDEAKPALAIARPVVDDLRPFMANGDDALREIKPVAHALDRDTNVVGLYLTVLQSFFANTTSVFGVHDGQGGNIRGHFVAKFPDGTHFFPGGDPGYSPTDADAGTGPGTPSPFTPAPSYIPGAGDYDPDYNKVKAGK